MSFQGINFLLDKKSLAQAGHNIEQISLSIIKQEGEIKARISKQVDIVIVDKNQGLSLKIEKYPEVKVYDIEYIKEQKESHNITGKVNSFAQAEISKDAKEDSVEKPAEKAQKLKADEVKHAREEIKEEKIVKATKKGTAAVDHLCPVQNQCHVYADKSTTWEAMLNQTNISRNNNKFYLIQLLEADNNGQFYCWFRWGRVGENGQTNLENHGTLASAKSSFMKKFKDKTKNNWDQRDDFQHYDGKYDLIDRDWGDNEDEKEKVPDTPQKNERNSSKLHPRVQDLMKLIFDVKMMERSMVEIGYDANKMPLGKLTKTHIQRGFDVLNDLSVELESEKPSQSRLMELSSRFYTIIPHSFGRQTPPAIKSKQELKKKIEMLESLEEIQIATKIISNSAENDQRNVIDGYYDSLKNEIVPVDKDSEVYKLIELYVANTHAPTHDQYKLSIAEVFECKREGENPPERWDNRQLLWHGSRLTNFVGILSQGLRIAPPEAPVTGYMFGKGVYFADMVSKSANYCFTSRSSPTGLLLLCDVGLGSPVELLNADYNADKLVKAGKGQSTKGVGGTFPDPSGTKVLEDGVKVPCGKYTICDKRGALQYNEYIVYDTKQIRMKYLVKLNFQYKY